MILSCTHWSVSPTMAHLEGERAKKQSMGWQVALTGASCDHDQTQVNPWTGSPHAWDGEVTGGNSGLLVQCDHCRSFRYMKET